MQGVNVELNGETKLLRYNINNASDLEEYFGKGIKGILNEEQIGFRLVRAFYWAGLRHGRDRGLTMEKVGQMLMEKVDNGEGLDELMNPVLKALDRSGLLGKDVKLTQDDDEEDEGEPKN